MTSPKGGVDPIICGLQNVSSDARTAFGSLSTAQLN